MGRGTLVKYRKWNIGEADRSAVDTLRSAGYSWLLASVLAARGVTELSQVQFIERGYEDLVGKLRAVGADIRVEEIPEAQEAEAHIG